MADHSDRSGPLDAVEGNDGVGEDFARKVIDVLVDDLLLAWMALHQRRSARQVFSAGCCGKSTNLGLTVAKRTSADDAAALDSSRTSSSAGGDALAGSPDASSSVLLGRDWDSHYQVVVEVHRRRGEGRREQDSESTWASGGCTMARGPAAHP